MTSKQQADLETLYERIGKALAAKDLEALCDYSQKFHDHAESIYAEVKQKDMRRKGRPYRIA